MQIGGDAFFFQFARLMGPAAGDEGERRPDGADRLHLLAAYLRRSEAEDAGAPRPAGEPCARLPQQFLGIVAAQQGQGQKGQCAVARDRLGERGGVADARHRSLHDGIARAVPLSERRPFGRNGHESRVPGSSTGTFH